MNTTEFAKRVPKSELHLHIEGSLEPELMFKLSKKNNIEIPFNSVEEVKAAYEFENLQDFLNIYYQGANVLITQEDFYDLTWAYLEKAKQDNVKHVEIFFDPQTHTQRGIAFETVIKGIYQALEDGKSKLDISSYLIMCFLRDMTEAQAFETLEQAKPFKEWIKAVGLDSAEVGHPPEKFKQVFDEARAQGYLTVAHAGEEGPAEYIWEAIDLLKVSRIDHGIRCVDDPKLVDYLKQHQIPLTVCPFSNVKLRAFDKLNDHNIFKLLDKGLCVTVNSDDPSYFGGYVNDNFVGLVETFDATYEQIAQLAKNSFTASFLDPSARESFNSSIDELLVEIRKAS